MIDRKTNIKKPAAQEEQQPSLDSAFTQLEELIARLESGEAPLESAISDYEEGVHLVRRAQALLTAAEQRVRTLESDGVDADGSST